MPVMRSSNHNDHTRKIVMAEPFQPIGAAAVNVLPRLTPEVPIFPRYPGVAIAVANHLARREIERQWRAKGLRITRYADVIEQARAYLAEHPELFDKALDIVRASPWHRAQAEREERELDRQRRKSARAGTLE
jgi:hypothetical protein